MWPSWVFGPSILPPPAQLPARCLLEPQKGPIGWGLPGIIRLIDRCVSSPETGLACRVLAMFARAALMALADPPRNRELANAAIYMTW